MKICSRCGASKPLSHFHNDRSKKDRHTGICKDCACNKTRGWYIKNRDHVLAYQSEYGKCHKSDKQEYDRQYRKDNYKKLIDGVKRWITNHPDKRHEYQKRYRAKHGKKLRETAVQHRIDNGDEIRKAEQYRRDKNRDTERSRIRKWKNNHPNSVKADKENQRAKQSNVPGKFTSEDIKRLYSIQDGVCIYHYLNPYCLVDLNFAFHIDHINPLVRGGSNYPDNLQLLCHLCNETKGRKTDKEFRDWLAYIYPK